jgi:hypothetical protein
MSSGSAPSESPLSHRTASHSNTNSSPLQGPSSPLRSSSVESSSVYEDETPQQRNFRKDQEIKANQKNRRDVYRARVPWNMSEDTELVKMVVHVRSQMTPKGFGKLRSAAWAANRRLAVTPIRLQSPAGDFWKRVHFLGWDAFKYAGRIPQDLRTRFFILREKR